MRKILIGAGIVLLLAIAGLLAAPSFIDWNEHRERIASWLSETLGREVAIDGPLRLTLLPTPHLSAGGVRIAAAPGAAEPDLLRVRAIEATVAPAALLSGRIAVTQASLADPVLTVERLPDGRMSWALPERAPEGSPSDAPPQNGRGGGGGPGFTVAVDRLTIANGTVVYRDGAAPGVTARRGESIDAVVTIAGPSGPVRVQGTFAALGGHAFRLTASTDRLDPAAPARRIPFTAMLEAPQDHGRLEVSGEAALDPEPAFKGRLRLGGDDAAALAAAFLGHAPVDAAAAWPGAFAGRLDAAASVAASARSVALDPLSVEIGETRGSGAVRIEPGSPATVAASLAVPRLDLDRGAAAAGTPERPAASGPAAAADAQTGAPAVAPALSAIRTALPAAAALRGSLDLNVDAIIWRGGLVRDTRLEATLDRGELRVARASALLPGGTGLRVQGAIRTGDPGDAGAAALRSDGTIEADADNLRGTLDWLGVRTTRVPADRLRRTSLRARLALAGERLAVDDLALSLDASRVTGAMTVALRDRIGIGARLAVDQLSLDAYRLAGGGPARAGAGTVAAVPTPPAGTAPQPSPDTVPASATAAEWPALDGFDANLDVSVGTLTAGGQPVEGAHLVGTLQRGDLTVSDASLRNLAGTSLKASGLVSRIGQADATVQAAFEAKGEAIERLLRLTEAPPALATHVTGPFTASGDLQGEAASGRMAVDAEMTALGGGRLHASGEVGRHRLDLLLDAAHPSTAALLRQIAPSYHPAAGGDLGALTLSGHLAREEGGQRWHADDLNLSVGGAVLLDGSEIALALDGPRPALRADLRVGDLAVDPFLPASRSAAATAPPATILRPGILLAQAGGRPAAADGPSTAASSPRWSQTPLDLSALGAVDAEATLAGRGLAYGAWKLESPDAALSLKDGVLTVPKLAGTLFGGALSGHGRLVAGAPGGTPPDASAELTLRQADLRPLLGETVGAHVEGRLDLDADLVAAGRSPADLVASLGGTARIASRDGTLNGIDVQAVSDRLKDTSRTADFLALGRAIAGGATRYRTLDGTFRVEHGVARSDDLKLTADAATADASATVDLPRWQLRSRVAFTLTELPKAPPLVLTLDGSLDDPRKVVEINPFQRYLTQRNAEQQRSGDAPPSGEPRQ
ncbi:MAG TPA: AsmA family protein [Stellaceae bacterium]